MASIALVSALVLSQLAQASPISSDLTARNNWSKNPSVKLDYGTLNGRYLSDFEQDLYLGVPYAQAPTGDLRFRNPQPVNTSYDQAFDASQWGNVCPGYGPSSSRNESQGQFYNLDEDCLNINLIVPAGTTPGDNLPVLFWIYGGGYSQGTANDPRYNGSYIVQTSVELGEPIIFASINYRLSAFGFPAGQEAVNEGVLNLGTKDQRQALKWVNKNIYNFGGDASKVTVWGQSAGGSSATNQVVAYGGRNDGLVHGVIATSGTSIGSDAEPKDNFAGWASLLEVTGCSDLACLRALPYDTLYDAIAESDFSGGPVRDGDILPNSIVEAFKKGEVLQVPIIFGNVRDEATFGIGAPEGINNETAFLAAVANRFEELDLSEETINQFAEVYPNNNTRGCPFHTGDGVVETGLQNKRSNWVYTDNIVAGCRYLAQQHSNRAPAYRFQFDQVPQNQSIQIGATHANELPYTFGVLDRTARTPLGNRPEDLELSRNMQAYTINFVRSGDPNKGTSGKGSSREVTWEKYDKSQSLIIFENNYIRTESDSYRADTIDFLIGLATDRID